MSDGKDEMGGGAWTRPGPGRPRSRLIAVRGFTAFVLAQALIVSPIMPSPLHVHEYIGHDHPDHQHGPASHEHHPSSPSAEQAHHGPQEDGSQQAAHVESCDPGRHAAAVAIGCAPVPPPHVDVAELPGPMSEAAVAPAKSAVPVIDVRVHGPPFKLGIPARAPPLTSPA
jgi:hypothetical protein